MAVKEFNYRELKKLTLSHNLLNMLTKIHEYKGKQDIYIATKPEILTWLTDLALIQTTEASNKIEGIATTDGRLKQIVAEKVAPRNRDEEEIAGYRDVLKLIHDSYDYIRVVPKEFASYRHRRITCRYWNSKKEILEYDRFFCSYICTILSFSVIIV